MADKEKQPWSFDVSSLMILINEAEEQSYRLCELYIPQRRALAAIRRKVVEGADLNPTTGTAARHSASDRWLTPSRSVNCSKTGGLKVFKVPDTPQKKLEGNFLLLIVWVTTTWVLFAGLLAFTIRAPDTTWIGIANCTVITGWSIIVRVVEHLNMIPVQVDSRNVTDPGGVEAIIIMGRHNSALVLEGSRSAIKDWTARGLSYKDRPLGVSSGLWQFCTRLVSLLVLLLIFTTIPNGSTMDQVAFIIINLLAQLNSIIGQHMHSRCCLMKLEKSFDIPVATKTHAYGELMRRFKEVEEHKHWVEAWGFIPKTAIWDKWRMKVMQNESRDDKELYEEIARGDGREA